MAPRTHPSCVVAHLWACPWISAGHDGSAQWVLLAFRGRVAESSALGLVEAVAGVTLGLLGIRDILAGAGLITFGSRFGRRGALGGLASRVPRKDSRILRLNGCFHCGRSGALGLRCRTLSLDGGLGGRSSD
jgi:hypothetical protein